MSITVTDTLTGRELTATDVESALAEQQPKFRSGWVPNPSYRQPTTSPDTPPPDVDPVPLHHDGRPLEHVRLPRRNGHQVPAYGYGRLVGQSTLTPNRIAVRDVRLHQEVGYEHLQQQAQDWRDLEWDAAQVKHLPPITVSDEYRANRDVLERLYARDLQVILDGGAPLPDNHPARELAPANLDADAARRRKALAAAAQRKPVAGPPHRLPPPPPPPPPPLSGAELVATRERVKAAFRRLSKPEPEPRSWRDYGGIIAGAAIGLVAFAALLIGRAVL